ncbi:MAG: methyltransferase domain-containing protein [Candidatus Omnitrophica bacterium]|nr:methyltransferase domain-containing protein [Candidatus Omnitrophota bacterium]
MTQFQTEQEHFWAGDFGNEYSKRNVGESLIASNVALFARILRTAPDVRTILEFGANIGLNLQALRRLLPSAKLSAIEINKGAVEELRQWAGDSVQVYPQSILDYKPDGKRDFVLSKTVLIHINPEELQKVFSLLYASSSKYICLCEYYSPVPVEVNYRGHTGKLFKRDFAGDMLRQYPDLRLRDYGFIYHGDLTFPQDDVNWFLLEKVK